VRPQHLRMPIDTVVRMTGAAEKRIRWVVRESRRHIRWRDPARFRPGWKRRSRKRPQREYDTPALVVARALMDGATGDEAVEVLRREVDDAYGRKLKWNRERKLLDDLRATSKRLSERDAEGW
jgi:hypothetical protein